ncbi:MULTISPECIES: hypothetical protein [Calothrix]|uniref:Uncharacterized protein n=2 Tax=Calothrix TaxID=1186 RepID=A0ABR8A5I4_9CYAN|nr:MULTISPECIES: hypothetical protein [Calothrix]MBD2195237.1 hypothetical protein [Calothrix parietina FACHB-288]MBD2223792.1 hypothetical protein [Calothrix anomala FACHB-343]
MSGTKAYTVSGIAPLATQALLAGVAVAGFTVASGVMATGTAVVMAAKAAKAYQERIKREAEKALQQEAEIQRQIIAARRSYSQTKTMVQLPQINQKPRLVNTLSNNDVDLIKKDLQIKIREQKSRLPRIKKEYQNLIESELLDAATVLQAWQNVEQALDSSDLPAAEAYLQALDNARIEAFKQLRSQLQSAAEYAQTRLDAIAERLPKAIAQNIASTIERIHQRDRPIRDADLLAIHQQITTAELQIDRVWEAAENLVKAWQNPDVDYTARIIGIDDGDVVVEIETHENQQTGEAVNTVMRVQFTGQQIDLKGPHEETSNCAARTGQALQIFQEQGYYLEWDSLDGQPIPEEYRQIYSAPETTTLEIEPPQRRPELETY